MAVKIYRYTINSSVIIASIVALMGALVDFLSDGVVVQGIAEVIMYFLGQPDSFRPYMTEKVYQALLTFLPILSIFLRVHRTRGLPPIEKIEKHE